MIVRTVLGDISPEALGVCYPHEHVLGQPPPQMVEADFLLNDEAAAIAELKAFKQAGGNALVEMSTPDYNRNAAGLVRVSEATGVHIVATTGYNQEKYSAPFLKHASIEELTERFIHEVQNGMDGTDIRAGVIKASSTRNMISADAERLFRAAARAHHVTGAPISTHTEAGTMALEQVELLTSEGVDPAHIIIGHIDRRLDWDFQLKLAQTGVFFGYDQIGKAKYYPDAERAAFILRLAAEGHGQQILLAGDMARRSYWGVYGGMGFAYILEGFIPILREQDAADALVDDLLVHNPRRSLGFLPK